MRHKILTSVTTPLIVSAVAFNTSCSSRSTLEPTGQPDEVFKAELPKEKTGFGIKVYLGENLDTLMELGPPRRAGESESKVDEEKSVEEKLEDSRLSLMKVRLGNNQNESDLEAIEDGLDDHGWDAELLAWAAASECRTELLGVDAGEESQHFNEYQVERYMLEVPWAVSGYNGVAFYHYPYKRQIGEPSGRISGLENFWDCEEVLFYQELTLCTAQKLAQVAETTTPLVWQQPKNSGFADRTDGKPGWRDHGQQPEIPNVADGNGLEEIRPPDAIYQKWTIPPQQGKDVFIARDLAINALSHLSLLNEVQPKGIPGQDLQPMNCDETYRTELAASTHDNRRSWVISQTGSSNTYFGTSRDIWGVEDTAARKEHVVARMQRKAAVLSQAGELLKDLVEKSVTSDLANAAHVATGADPKEAARQAWGVSNNAFGRYGNRSHALGTVLGRQEYKHAGVDVWLDPQVQAYEDIGLNTQVLTPTKERKCEGLSDLDIIRTVNNGYGGSQTQLNARWNSVSATRVEQVDAWTRLAESGILIPPDRAEGSSESTLRQAILDQLLWDALPEGYSSPDAVVSGSSFRDSVVGQAIEADLARLTREDLLFAVNRMADAYQVLTNQSLFWGSLVGQSIPLSSGLVAKANVAQPLATLGGTAVTGGLNAQDLNADNFALAGAAQTNTQCTYMRGSSIDSNTHYSSHFHSTFGLAFKLREALASQAKVLDDRGFEGEALIAASGAAALRTWVQGSVNHFGTVSSQQQPGVTLRGFAPSDVGLTTYDEVRDNLVLVFGEPWVANCAAGLRTTCPPNFQDDYVVEFSSVTQDTTKPLSEVTLKYSTSNLPPQFAFSTYGKDSLRTSGKRLYLVSRTSPSTPSKGMVLAALSTVNANGSGGLAGGEPEVISNWQHVLVDEILEMPWDLTQPTVESCVALDEDYFVPLENELTSDGDGFETSWRHYLGLAENAAARADELGRELISRGLERDQRREVASEELAALCGAYGSLDDFDFSDTGAVIPPSDDGTLKQCLDEPTYDVVFLTSDPYVGWVGPQPDGTGRLVPCSAPGVEYDPQATSETGICDSIKSTLLDCSGEGHTNPLCEADELSYAALDLAPAILSGSTTSRGCIEGVRDWAEENGDDTSALRRVFLSPELDQARISSALSAMQVNISENENTGVVWDATYQGAVFMSSHNTAHYPACLTSDSCTSQTSQDLAALFGDEVPSDPSKLHDAAMRVTRAMWLMAAWSGGMPSGRINLPVLAANFRAVDGSPLVKNAPAPMVYGMGEFTKNAHGSWTYSSSTPINSAEGTALDRTAMGTLVLPVGAYAEAVSSSNAPTLPIWLRQVYGDGTTYYGMALTKAAGYPFTDLTDNNLLDAAEGAYLHIPTSNAAIAFDAVAPGGLVEWLNQYLNADYTTQQGEASPSTREEVLNIALNSGAMCRDGGYPAFAGPQSIHAWVRFEEGSTRQSMFGYNLSAGAQLHTLSRPGRSFVQVTGNPGQGGAPYIPPVDDNEDNNCIAATAKGVCVALDNALTPPTAWTQTLLEELCVNTTPALIPLFDTLVVPRACRKNAVPVSEAGNLQYPARLTGSAMSPSLCPPNQRVGAFSGQFAASYNGGLGSADMSLTDADITRAAGLSCLLGGAPADLPDAEPIPPIDDPDDIVKYKAWLRRQAHYARRALGSLIVQKVPERVVNDFRRNRIGTGDLRGSVGQLALSQAIDLRAIATGWTSLAGDLDSLANAVDGLSLQLRSIDISQQKELVDIAMRQIDQQSRVAKGFVAIASTISGMFNPASYLAGAATIAQGMIEVDSAMDQLTQLNRLAALTDVEANNRVAIALNTFQQTTIPLFTNVQNTIRQLQTSSAQALSTASQLSQARSQAAYAAAKGIGANAIAKSDAAFDSDQASDSPINVNTVQTRLYSITQKRYEESVGEAKRMAFLAKNAIEQRLGVRLRHIHTDVGTLGAPSTWMNEYCAASGIDYEALRTAEGFTYTDDNGDVVEVDAAHAAELLSHTDKFIGDYVNKLRSFVEYYNLDFPTHEGSDVALLSVRDDLMVSPAVPCFVPSQNLLYYSDELGSKEQVNGDVRGWTTSYCAPDVPEAPTTLDCLVTSRSAGLRVNENGEPLQAPLAETDRSGFTWLHDSRLTVSESQEPIPEDPAVAPKGVVYQKVSIQASGTYTLSWWDMARSLNGDLLPLSEAAVPYSAVVHSGDWGVIADEQIVPNNSRDAEGNAQWSTRRSISFSAAPGNYIVAFNPSHADGSLGSVAIANVQLEAGADPAAYTQTNGSDLVLSDSCRDGTGEDFRSAFTYRCSDDKRECWYELDSSLNIDAEAIGEGSSDLARRFASGNSNYRHKSVALNVVGTGVIDCSGTQDTACYGSGFIEYSLEHAATNVPVQTGTNPFGTEHFDFGTAYVSQAKALATERYLTLPISSADQSLLGQEQTTKTEFFGRPIGGSYKLRIYDQPGLRWERVEDVQLMLNYGYWAGIQRSSL